MQRVKISKQRVKEMCERGMCQWEIAKECGVSQASVSREMARWGFRRARGVRGSKCRGEENDQNLPAVEPEPALSEVIENDAVNHPKHYMRPGAMECIDEMVLIFGAEQTGIYCKINAWKYRYRAAAKNGEEDIAKSDWYIRKAKELENGNRYD